MKRILTLISLTFVYAMCVAVAGLWVEDINKVWYWVFMSVPITFLIWGIYAFGVSRSSMHKHRAMGDHVDIKRRILDRLLHFISLPTTILVPIIGACMLIVWSLGWVLYSCALYYSIGSLKVNGTEMLVYSAISSLDMFMLDVNDNVIDNTTSSFLKGAIPILSVIAIILTFSLLLSLFINRLVALIHSKSVKVDKSIKHLYVFWGVNDKSQLLKQSIRDSQTNDYLIVTVEETLVDEDETDGFSTMIGMFTHRKRTFDSVKQSNNEVLLFSEGKLSEIDSHALGQNDDVLSKLHLSTLRRILRELNKTEENKPDVGIFFLSENRDENIKDALTLSDDATINDLSKEGIKVTFYCQSRFDGVTRIFQDSNKTENIEFAIVDDSHLAVEYLKRQKEAHPVNFVTVDTTEHPGTVNSPFNALIVGFSETGQDMARFIYEYGAFAHFDTNDGLVKRSQFHCYVIDQRVNILQGEFVATAPGIFSEQNVKDNGGDPLISFYDYEILSQPFYNLLKQLAPELNHVTVALGDDETNLEVAVKILRHVRRFRKDLTNFRIYVRAYERDKSDLMELTAKTYNDLASDESGGSNVIEIFGKIDQLYLKDVVIDEVTLRDAKLFFERYNEITRYDESWDVRHASISDPHTPWAMKTNIRDMEAQERSNSLHARSKIILIEKVLYNRNVTMEQLAAMTMKRDDNGRITPIRTGSKEEIDYPEVIDPIIKRLLRNMAIFEHLRWNASHELQGYRYDETVRTPGNERNVMRGKYKLHDCLTSWHELTQREKDVLVYDYLVVETSISLHHN